jgi:pimeloyl-ACP methyl ester carboxylesterase
MGDLALALLAPSSNRALGEWLDIGLWPDAAASQRQANNTTPVEDWWPGGSKPMLVIQGLHDRTAPPTNGYALCEEFGERVRLVDLPDAGHGLVVEQPELIAAAIDDWVRG